MSGGSWDYAYVRFEDIACRLRSEASPKRRALGIKVQAMAEALRAIEWVDSGDMGGGDDEAAIDAVVSPGDVLAEAVLTASEAYDVLGKAIAAAKAQKCEAKP